MMGIFLLLMLIIIHSIDGYSGWDEMDFFMQLVEDHPQ